MKLVPRILLISLIIVVGVSLSRRSASADSVLLVLREQLGSSNEQYMGTNEAIVMKRMLEEAGFRVVIASASGRTFHNGETLRSDLTLNEVEIADYVGFLFACMALGTPVVKPEEVVFAAQLLTQRRPIAAQRKGVNILAEAGVLAGRQYSYESEPDYPGGFNKGIYAGNGVVRDGNLITSSYCPYHGKKDQTAELMRRFIAALQE